MGIEDAAHIAAYGDGHAIQIDAKPTDWRGIIFTIVSPYHAATTINHRNL